MRASRRQTGRRACAWRALAVAGLIALGLAGCQRILPIFFDGVPDEGTLPPTRRVRRDLLAEIEELKRKLDEAERAEQAARLASEKKKEEKEKKDATGALGARTWEDAVAVLPTDAGGSVDWVRALEQGVIAPEAGPTPEAREQAVIELDVDLDRYPSKVFRVKYPHRPHTQWLACGSCHPAIFPLRGPEPTRISMARIRAGEQCGVCHGKVAFGPDGRCVRCHQSIPAGTAWRPPEPRKPIESARRWEEAQRLLPAAAGAPDWAKALSDGVIAPRPGVDDTAADQPVFPITVERVPAGNPVFKAVFPHAAHTALITCTSCHPAIFQMARGQTPITMAKIFAGEYCGTCHGKVAFAVPTGCPRCHPALGGR